MKKLYAVVCGVALSMTSFSDVMTDCYWHWMNGNVSKEGITADLEYMKAGGMEAAMIFDVGIGAKRGEVDYASDAWRDCVAWASREAERLGMELSLHNSPGYSACGGPWIKPEESMKQLVWHVETSTSGVRSRKSSALGKEQSQGQLKFTLDYEATKKHLFETEFLAPFAERAHKLGLLVAGEPYGDGDFDMETFVKYLDLPMSEYWARSHYGSMVAY